MKKKSEIREEIASDVERFLADGGTITESGPSTIEKLFMISPGQNSLSESIQSRKARLDKAAKRANNQSRISKS